MFDSGLRKILFAFVWQFQVIRREFATNEPYRAEIPIFDLAYAVLSASSKHPSLCTQVRDF